MVHLFPISLMRKYGYVIEDDRTGTRVAEPVVERVVERERLKKTVSSAIMTVDTPIPTKIISTEVDAVAMAEYAELAKETGVRVPELEIEQFKAFLREHDIPTFQLREVVLYMNVAARSNKNGWEWKALRPKDREALGSIWFGEMGGSGVRGTDFYHHYNSIYDLTLPMHVLRKVAKIDKAFSNRVALLVSDYASRNPDPFLMAVIPNSRMANGVGRFVIDVWKEPGFGIDKQLAPA